MYTKIYYINILLKLNLKDWIKLHQSYHTTKFWHVTHKTTSKKFSCWVFCIHCNLFSIISNISFIKITQRNGCILHQKTKNYRRTNQGFKTKNQTRNRSNNWLYNKEIISLLVYSLKESLWQDLCEHICTLDKVDAKFALNVNLYYFSQNVLSYVLYYFNLNLPNNALFTWSATYIRWFKSIKWRSGDCIGCWYANNPTTS